MTEREFEERLRAFYRAEADAHWLPSELVDAVSSIPGDVPTARVLPSRRSVTLLAAAAMLVTLLLAGALAIGFGLLRLPWVPDPPANPLGPLSTVMLTPIPCDQTLPDGVVLDVTVSEPNGPPSQLVVYEDGRSLRGTSLFEGLDDWQVRRLTPEGVTALTAAIEHSGLRDCIAVPVAGPDLTVRARLGAGVVAMSLGSGWSRVPSDAELAAAASLAGGLGDDDLGVAADLWQEASWGPYEHDRWALHVRRWSVPGLVVGPGLQMGVDWRTLELPDGSLISSLGAAMPDPADSRFDDERCGVVSSDVVEQLRERLGETLEDQRNSWAFLHPETAIGGLHVTVAPLLPHQLGCEEFEQPTPAARDGPLIPELRVCDYLDDPDDVASEPPAGWRQIWESADFGGGWAACEYYPGGWVFASRHPVTSQQAEAIALHQFGPGVTSKMIGGRTVYLNACDGPEHECSPAIAISDEPHFVVVVPDDAAEDLRELARIVIEGLD